MLRGEDFQDALVGEAAAVSTSDPDVLAGPFAHVVVDEAQELTDAEWQMLLLRCPSRSFTIVGDRAQARHGFTESWQERLERIGLDRIGLATLLTTLPLMEARKAGYEVGVLQASAMGESIYRKIGFKTYGTIPVMVRPCGTSETTET